MNRHLFIGLCLLLILLPSVSAAVTTCNTFNPHTGKLDCVRSYNGSDFVVAGSGDNTTLGGGWRNDSGSGNISLVNQNVNISANTLFIDNTNGRVGVGTTAPRDRLEVVATADITGMILNNTVQSPIFRLASGHSNAAARDWCFSTNMNQFGDFDFSQSAAKGGSCVQGAGGMSRMHFDGSTGNVGINTTNPSATLHVNAGGAYADKILKITNRSGDSALTITGDKRVYVGVDTGYDAQMIVTNPAGSTRSVIALVDNNIAGNPEMFLESPAVGEIGITTSGTNKLIFGNRNVNNEQMTIDRSGNLTVDATTLYVDALSNTVGVGTITPNSYGKLDVNGKIILESEFITQRDNSGITQYADFLLREAGAACGFGLSETGCMEFYTYSAANDINAFLIGTYQPEPLIFGTAQAERMRIDGTGKVGIGVTTPASQFDIRVNTSQTDFGSSSTANQGIMIGPTQTNPGYPVGVMFGGYPGYSFGGLYGVMTSGAGSTLGDIVFAQRRGSTDAGFNETMRVLSTGKVGIGTSNPSTTLHVVGNLTVSERIGVNTASPASAFHIATSSSQTDFGSQTIAEQGISLINGNGVAGRPYGIQFGGYPDYSFGGMYGVMTTGGGYTVGDVVFAQRRGTLDTRFNETMRIVGTNGYVGIGTSVPSQKLEVNGTLKFSEANGITNEIVGPTDQVLNVMGGTGQPAYLGGTYVGFSPGGVVTYYLDGTFFGPWNPGAQDLGSIASNERWRNIHTEHNITTRSGKVGIGTETPVAALQIGNFSTSNKDINITNGTLYVRRNGGDGGVLSMIVVENNDTGIKGTLGIGNSGWAFGNSVTSAAMIIQNTAPASMMDLGASRITFSDTDGIQHAASTNFVIKSNSDGAAGNSIILQGFNGAAWQNAITLPNKASGNIDVIMNGGGNLGIGTATPVQKLDVVGSANITGDIILSRPGSSIVVYNGTNACTGTTTFLNATTSNYCIAQIATSCVTANSMIFTNLQQINNTGLIVGYADGAAPVWDRTPGVGFNLSNTEANIDGCVIRNVSVSWMIVEPIS